MLAVGSVFLKTVDHMFAGADYESNLHRLCYKLGFRIRVGDRSAVLPGPPYTVVLPPHLIGWSRSIDGLHELAHVILASSGLEAALYGEIGEPETAYRIAERLCWLGAGVMRVPTPILNSSLRAWGEHPLALIEARQITRAPWGMMTARWTFADPERERAAFIVTGNHVKRVETCNLYLPFRQWDRVPEIDQVLPGAKTVMVPGVGRLGMFAP